jgi:hypothetical protein
MQKDDMQQSYSGQEQAQKLAERVTSQIESMPPDRFLLGAALSVGASLVLRLTGRYQDALFVGQWAPTLLLVGLYSKAMSTGALRQEPQRPHEPAGDAMH